MSEHTQEDPQPAAPAATDEPKAETPQAPAKSKAPPKAQETAPASEKEPARSPAAAYVPRERACPECGTPVREPNDCPQCGLLSANVWA